MTNPRVRTRLLRAGILAGLAAGILAPATATAQNDTTFALSRNAIVDLTVRSGMVLVRGTNGSTGELRTNDTRYQLRSTGVGITLATRETGARSYTRDADDSRVELLVPRGVRLVISAGTADVEVRDIEGEVEVRSRSGDIHLQRLGQRVIIETFSGDITLDDGVGVARVVTSSGNVTLRGVRTEADVHTTSGDVALETAGTSRITAETISGDVEVDGSLAGDARVRVSTHSGDVALRLGESLRGVLQFETHNGELTTTGSLLMVGPVATAARGEARQSQRFEFGGGGGAALSVSTFNGDVRFIRGARQPSN